MIPITIFSGQKVAVFGLGGSGRATLEALVAGGALVSAYDDKAESRDKAADIDGVSIVDLRQADWSEFAALVLAPGVPLTHPEPHWSVKLAQAADVEIIGDIELFCRQRRASGIDCPFVAITGTNGKSTTTALISHILSEAGLSVQMGGNIGMPVLALGPIGPEQVYVIEISSYQIDLSPSLDPSVGVMLNLSADHIDRHGDLLNYARIKARLVARSGVAVVGIDDRLSANIASNLRIKGHRAITISGLSNERAMVRTPDGFLHYKKQDFLFNMDQARALRGAHNAQNAAAAIAVAFQFDLSSTQISQALISFGGLAHRMEEVGELCLTDERKLLFINDSKATNADATSRALITFRSIYWILGGLPKTGGINDLVDYFDRIEHAYLIGKAAEEFAQTLSAHDVSYTHCDHMDVALEKAVEDACKAKDGNGVILLSPACASFDQFASFEQRGDIFRDLVNAYFETGSVPVEPDHKSGQEALR